VIPPVVPQRVELEAPLSSVVLKLVVATRAVKAPKVSNVGGLHCSQVRLGSVMPQETMDTLLTNKTFAENKRQKEVTSQSKTAEPQLVCKPIWHTMQMVITSSRQLVTS
jgi:CRISPR/Cas system-associated exonuclease Cas4 (RecB family)